MVAGRAHVEQSHVRRSAGERQAGAKEKTGDRGRTLPRTCDTIQNGWWAILVKARRRLMMSPSTTSLFVDYHLGGYPLLITCPHNGSQHPSSTPERPAQQPGCRNKKQADLFTRKIALGVFDSVEDSIGAAPSNVVARFHRRFIDANRPERCAFLAPEARPFYRDYHRRIRRGLAKIKMDFPRRGLLVDIHGAADLPDQPGTHVLLGSDGGRSISRLLALDSKILWRRRGLVRTLEAAGFGVIPANAGDPDTRTLTEGSPLGGTAPPMHRDSMPFRSKSCAVFVRTPSRARLWCRRSPKV